MGVRRTALGMAAPKTLQPAKSKGKRLVVDLPDDVHRALKARAALAGKSVRDFVLELLKAQGIG